MKPFLLAIFSVSFGLLTACSPAAKQDLQLEGSTGVIYDYDTRTDVKENQTSVMNVGKATAMLVKEFVLKQHANGSWYFNSAALGHSYPLCENEKFLDQPSVGFCSGVLIAPDKVLTASHCMQVGENRNNCASTKFVFGWTEEDSKKNLSSGDIYSCQKILKSESVRSRGIDYAIVQLDRPVIGTIPVKIASTQMLLEKEPVMSLSYPLGIPLKKDIGHVLSDTKEGTLVKVEVDTFQGSSGSPLFNAKGELIGILSTGMEDFIEDDIYRVQTQGGCLNFRRCTKGICRGESFFKTSHIDL